MQKLNNGGIPVKIYQKCIRDTVTCMYAMSSQPHFNNWPAWEDLDEIAKSICLKYPQLKNRNFTEMFKLPFYFYSIGSQVMKLNSCEAFDCESL